MNNTKVNDSDLNDFMNGTEGFLGLPKTDVFSHQEAKAWVIPFGLETSVSYQGGTHDGPQAILNASHQVELFDERFWCEPFRQYGVATLRPLSAPALLSDALDQLEHTVESTLAAQKFPLIIGGEHSITAGSIRPFARRYERLTVLQFDAHADLRDGYEGEHYSHAAAMRRCLDFENIQVVSVGIRNISAEEIPFYEDQKDRISIFWAKDIRQWNCKAIADQVGCDPVYISFDVDGFDSSLMPATGTPEPGGFFWDDVIEILAAVSKHTTLVGADVVELAPQPGLHACDFLTAKLCYNILSYSLYSR